MKSHRTPFIHSPKGLLRESHNSCVIIIEYSNFIDIYFANNQNDFEGKSANPIYIYIYNIYIIIYIYIYIIICVYIHIYIHIKESTVDET